jgi:hypothetical protein
MSVEARQLGDTIAWLYGDDPAPPLVCGWCDSYGVVELHERNCIHCESCGRDTSLRVAHELRNRRYPTFGLLRRSQAV